MIGKSFGRWKVYASAPTGRSQRRRWLCLCACGTMRIVQENHLISGRSRSCRCSISQDRPPVKICGNTALIPLTRGLMAIVDVADVDVGDVRWQSAKGPKTFYARRSVGSGGRKRMIMLHAVIAKRTGIVIRPGFLVDHRDGDGLNCRRENLRAATKSENGFNRGASKNSSSGIKGVSWNQRTGMWLAQLTSHGVLRMRKEFASKDDAISAHAAASKKYHRDFSNTSSATGNA